MPTTDADLIRRYQDLVSRSADVITLIDDTGVIEFKSQSVLRVLGYDQEDLVGQSLFEYVHPDDEEQIREVLEAALESPEDAVFETEYRFRHRDGSWVWLASTAQARSEAPEGGFVVNSRDVTERRRYEAQLEAERERYGTVLEGVNDAIAIVESGNIVYANPQCLTLLGYEDGTLVGQPLQTVVAPEDQKMVSKRYAQRIDPDQPPPPSRYEARFRTATDERIVGEINASPFVYEGEPAVLVAIRDVTERVAYEDQLEAMNEELEALNRVVRHDIRNDMGVILGWAEILEDHVDEEGRASLEKILASGQHVVELTDVARDFVETLGSGGAASLEPMSLRSVIETELTIRREFHPHATFEVEGAIPDVEVTANEMLSSVFTNLLNNAVQHNPAAEPSVVVSAAEAGDAVEVRVADDGPGIPDELKGRLFGKGEKGLDSTGTGIGLYLVRTILEQYGGSVRVEDNEPTGAVFVVQLPLAD